MLHRLETHVVRHARERFTDIERFTMAIEITVVVVGKRRIGAHLAGQDAARQRHSRDDRDVFLFCLTEEKSAGR